MMPILILQYAVKIQKAIEAGARNLHHLFVALILFPFWSFLAFVFFFSAWAGIILSILLITVKHLRMIRNKYTKNDTKNTWVY